MDILNNIVLTNKDNIFFNKAIDCIEKLESIELNYSILVDEYLNKMFKILEKLNSASLINSMEDIITVLNRLSCRNMSNILHFLDTQHSGLLLHYIMEAHRLSNKENILEILKSQKERSLLRTNFNKKIITTNEYAVFLNRLLKIEEENILKYIFCPTKLKFISELLKNNKEDENIAAEKQSLYDFHNWIKCNNHEENSEFTKLLDKNINTYIKEKEQKFTLIPKYLEEKVFLQLIFGFIIEDEEEDDEQINVFK